jgi:flagellar motor switch protein FliN
MNPTAASQATPASEEYIDVWLRHISEGLSQFVGRGVSVQAQGGEPASPSLQPLDSPGVWIRLFGGKAGEQAFFLPAADARQLSRLLSAETAAEEAALSAPSQEAVVQFFQQIATMIPALDWLGFNCEIEASAAERLEWEGAWQRDFQFSTEQGVLLNLHAQLSSDFVSAIERARGPVKFEVKTADALPRAGASGKARDANLDLLMDIELEVTLRFGQREMLLGDILNLSPGSVLELDQQVQDPVELLVGGRVIAWGEVVTVEGNYGLRVTGIASREERLQSIRK